MRTMDDAARTIADTKPKYRISEYSCCRLAPDGCRLGIFEYFPMIHIFSITS